MTVYRGEAYLGLNADSRGNAIVAGAGSEWANSGDLYVGHTGTGELTISDGAKVTNWNAEIGSRADSSGIVHVTGVGSLWASSQNLLVGDGGPAELHVEGGGKVTSAYSYIGLRISSNSTASVTGTGSEWFSSQSLYIGFWGAGELNVLDGGKVTNTEGLVGSDPSGSGHATVAGAGSHWINTTAIHIGGNSTSLDGTGVLTIADAGQVTAPNATIWSTGTLTGNGGTLVANVTNHDTIAPGSSPGVLTIVGNLIQHATSTLQIELGGAAASNHDKLIVNGGLNLDGKLQVSLINGFAPAWGDSFDILDWTTLGGSFAQLVLPSLNSLVWNTSQLYSSGLLSIALPGDFTFDGAVDAADFVVWRKGLGTTYTQNDYDTWRANFGRTATSGSSASGFAAVPEPTTPMLLIIAVAGWFRWRHRARL